MNEQARENGFDQDGRGNAIRSATSFVAFGLGSLIVMGCQPSQSTHSTASDATAVDSGAGATAGGSAEDRTVPGTARICEPSASCGVWRDCQWFERLSGTAERWRAVEGEGHRVFVRAHHCMPGDASPPSCQEYCTGKGSAARCSDALIDEHEECAGHAAPQRATFVCEVRGTACVTVR